MIPKECKRLAEVDFPSPELSFRSLQDRRELSRGRPVS